MLVAIGRLFHVGGEFAETSHGAVLASVMSMGLALLFAHYALQGVRQVLAGRELRLYIRRMAVPGVLAEASLLPLAVVFVLVYSPVEHIGMALLGATFLLINFVFNRLLRTQRILRQRVTELETLDTTARALSQSLQSASLIEPVARETLRAIPEADSLSLVLRDREGGLVVDTYRRGGTTPQRTRQAEPEENQRLVLERQQSVSQPEGRAWLGVPVVMYGEVDGVLAIDSAEADVFGPDQQRLLESLSAQVAVALQNAHLYELAMVDGLTGLFVRRYFDARLDEEVKRADRFGTSFSVVMMDIDDFKVINDTYGHPLGDRALRDIARVVRHQMRGVNTAARYGGEEIAMILPRTEMLDAYNQAERIRADIEALRLDHDGELLSVTASFGIASYPDSGAGSPVDSGAPRRPRPVPGQEDRQEPGRAVLERRRRVARPLQPANRVMSAGTGQGVSIRFLVGLGAVFIAAVGVAAVLLVRHASPDRDLVPLTAAERQELVRHDTLEGPVLEQPTIGFEIDSPGANYFASEQTVRGIRKANDDPSTRFYAYAELESGNLLVISVSKRPGQSAGAFSDMVHNVWNEFVQKTAVRLGEYIPVRTVEDRVDAATRTATVHGVLGSNAHLRLHAVGKGPYVVMAIGIGMGNDKLASVVASLHAN